MNAINVSNTVTIDHSKLGADVWEWNAEEQAKFLAGFAETFKAASGVGIMQISYMTEELRTNPAGLNAVRWLNELLTQYLEDQA